MEYLIGPCRRCERSIFAVAAYERDYRLITIVHGSKCIAMQDVTAGSPRDAVLSCMPSLEGLLHA